MRTSFLIPVYNTDLAILRLCINSALKAAGDEHEVVVVDDASSRAETQDFLSRCEASGFDNLTVLRNAENCGVSYSLNKAAANATGDLFIDASTDGAVGGALSVTATTGNITIKPIFMILPSITLGSQTSDGF